MSQSGIVLVLWLGISLLVAGSLSMLLVRLTSPGLRGVGWFSASFAAGSLGAAMQLAHKVPVLRVLGTDIAFLMAFVFMHLAVLELSQTQVARLWHGLLLVGVQLLVDLGCLGGVVSQHVRVSSLGYLIAVQVLTTAVTLRPLLKREVRTPAAYCVVQLVGFSAVNVLRSTMLLSGRGSAALNQRLGVFAFLVFIAVFFGLAFGFFWMTTASLTAQIEHLASTDPLTRVFNRRVFLRWCEKELLRSQRSGAPFSLLMVDLDHFKRINDNFGHQRGDEVLVAAVERMQDSVRGIDVLCRWGGEEFAVLLPNAPASSTRIVAERIRQNIFRMNVPLQCEEERLPGADRLTVSIGSATYRDLEDNLHDILARADQALYRAKGAGRDQVLVG